MILEAKELQVGYNSKTVLTIPELKIKRGMCLVLQGANGSGKSTLLKTVCSLLKPVSGSLTISSTKVAYVPQREPASMRIPINVYDYIRLGLLAPWLSKQAEASERMDSILQDLLLENCQHLRIGECSAGQFQRTLFARAWISDPELIILDEPSSSLDDKACQAVTRQIQGMLARKCTIILATHDERLQGPHVSKILRAHRGHLGES